jgi:hypothetical protein
MHRAIQTTYTLQVNEDNVSRQSSVNIFKDRWIHLPTTIVKESNVSRQSGIDLFSTVGFTYKLKF